MSRIALGIAATALLASLAACGLNPSAGSRATATPSIPRSTLANRNNPLPTTTATSVTNRSTRHTPIPPSATASPAPTSTQPVVGPEYREGFNPLTGLPVADPSTLYVAPLLVSITQFPPSARPQAGLSAAAQVWETSIGQGMSRFLAVYYGDYVSDLAAMLENHREFRPDDPAIGPIRSGRVGYEEIRRFYPKALLIIRSASPEVFEQLSNQVIIYADDPDDVNSAALSLLELRELEKSESDPAAYAQLVFDPKVPPGGTSGESLDIIFNVYNQIRWDYDEGLGAYARSQDQADGTGTLQPSFDRLSGAQLKAENVVVLYAQHKFENLEGTILSIELAYLPKRYGLLFRDGEMYEVQWSTRKLELQLEDLAGNVLPLKPGTTYFEVVSYETTWDEEQRMLRFHNPPLPTLTPIPSSTPTNTPAGTETPTATPTQ